jgi:hypothetical protein
MDGPFAGMFCADTQNQWLYLWLADGSDPNTHQVEAATRNALFGLSPWENREGVRFVHVRGFVFRHAATFPQRAAVWLHGGDNLLEDRIVEEMAGGGVNELNGLFVEISRDIVIVRNLFVRNGIGIVGKVEWPDWGVAGLSIAESQNCVVVSNTFVGNKDGIALREQGPRPLETEDYGTIPYHNRGYQLALWYDNGFFGRHPFTPRHAGPKGH